MRNFKIYFTSDIHGFIYPTDYRDNSTKDMGLLKLINSFHKDGNTLIIDGGDTIQGSPFTTYLSDTEFKDHPLGQVMNLGQYDFITLGNHDFNYGYEYLKKYLSTFNGNVICSNIIDKTNDLNIKPYSIKTLENGLKIGLIGLTTEFIPVWEKPENLKNIEVLSSFNSMKKYHDFLKNKVDILVGVYHGGFENDISTGRVLSDTSENLAYKICKELNFDILLTGHQHMAIENTTLFGTHIVQTPNNGTKFAYVEYLESRGITSKLCTPKAKASSFDFLDSIEYGVQAWLDTPVGFLDQDLLPSSHINMATFGSPLANFINEVQLDVSGADLACTSFANSIKGFNMEVTVRDIVSTYIYPNTLVVLEVTGEILKKALTRCSEYYHLNSDNTLEVSTSFLEPKVEHYNYDYFYNLDYTFDLSGEKPLISIFYKGAEISDTDKFTLVMNNYRASGTGGYGFFKSCPIIKEIQVEMTEILINYFKKYKNIKTNSKNWIKIKY